MEQITFWDKSRVIFVEDDTELCDDFKEGTEWELFMKQENNYIIYHRDVFYGPFKSKCKLI